MSGISPRLYPANLQIIRSAGIPNRMTNIVSKNISDRSFLYFVHTIACCDPNIREALSLDYYCIM